MKKKLLFACLGMLMVPAVWADQSLHFSQFGGGGGLVSDIVLTNPSPQNQVEGRVDFYASDGKPLFVSMAGANQNPVSGIDYRLEPLGTVTLRTLDEGELRQGSAVATSDGPLGGVIRFQIPGIGVTGVGVSHPASAFIIPARKVKNSINTGLAVHNPGDLELTLQLTLRNHQSQVLATDEQPIAVRGQVVGFIDSLFEQEIPAPTLR